MARIPTSWPPLSDAGEPANAEQRLRELQTRLRYMPEMSKEDRDALIDLIEVWRGWRVLVRSTRWIVVMLGALAAAYTTWNTVITALRAWLKG